LGECKRGASRHFGRAALGVRPIAAQARAFEGIPVRSSTLEHMALRAGIAVRHASVAMLKAFDRFNSASQPAVQEVQRREVQNFNRPASCETGSCEGATAEVALDLLCGFAGMAAVSPQTNEDLRRVTRRVLP
jgi:hypothetical protein